MITKEALQFPIKSTIFNRIPLRVPYFDWHTNFRWNDHRCNYQWYLRLLWCRPWRPKLIRSSGNDAVKERTWRQLKRWWSAAYRRGEKQLKRHGFCLAIGDRLFYSLSGFQFEYDFDFHVFYETASLLREDYCVTATANLTLSISCSHILFLIATWNCMKETRCTIPPTHPLMKVQKFQMSAWLCWSTRKIPDYRFFDNVLELKLLQREKPCVELCSVAKKEILRQKAETRWIWRALEGLDV